MGWIGVDFDGTLAEWGEGTSNPQDVLKVGAPILAMVARVKAWLAAGEDVRIFTARVGPSTDEECLRVLRRVRPAAVADHVMYIEYVRKYPQRAWDDYQRDLLIDWCLTHLGQQLPITATKDFHMRELWDDRCRQVVPNTGALIAETRVPVCLTCGAEPPGEECRCNAD